MAFPHWYCMYVRMYVCMYVRVDCDNCGEECYVRSWDVQNTYLPLFRLPSPGQAEQWKVFNSGTYSLFIDILVSVSATHTTHRMIFIG